MVNCRPVNKPTVASADQTTICMQSHVERVVCQDDEERKLPAGQPACSSEDTERNEALKSVLFSNEV